MEYQRILSVQDISCIGQCSMAVALPILSCCGHEAVMLPTAVLSTQTGVFGQPHVRDISGDIPAISEHWAREGIMFDAVLTGYLGTNESVRMVRELLAAHKACGARVIVDPVMADNGKLYAGFDESYCGAMRALCREADVMIPNITEAAILSGLPYREHYDADYIAALITHLDTENVVLTGVSFRPGETGVMVSESGALHYYAHRREEKNCAGTGDIFAAAFTGALGQGRDLCQAARLAADFTALCVHETVKNPAHRYGVRFEPMLPALIEMLYNT